MTSIPIIPPTVIVKDTGTAKGRGVFAGRAFTVGEIVEESPVVLLDTWYKDLPKDLKNIVFNWNGLCHSAGFGGSKFGCALAFGYAGVYNSSNPANLRYEPDPTHEVLRFIAIREIAVGEELTINYDIETGTALPHQTKWFGERNIQEI